jgi:transposase
MPPNYVKAYVRRQKNDAADAAAICEAVTRPSMGSVPIRSIGNQAILMHHKVRELLVSQACRSSRSSPVPSLTTHSPRRSVSYRSAR